MTVPADNGDDEKGYVIYCAGARQQKGRMRPPGARLALRLGLHATTLVLLFLQGSAARDSNEPEGPPFSYVAGTEDLPERCGGVLRLAPDNLVFACASHSINVPYAAISLMEYRPDISLKVVKMNVSWKVKGPVGKRKKSKTNRYFTVVFEQAGAPHVVVLEVSPEAMMPYFAGIELKTGKRVELPGYEDAQE